MSIENADIIRFSIDIWSEPGLLRSIKNSSGAFYYSYAVQAREFQFYMPKQQLSDLPQKLLSEIRKFYADKWCTPAVRCHENIANKIAKNKSDILFTEVYMKANVEDVLKKSIDTSSDKLTFKYHSDFKDKDYRSIYNDVFIPNADTRYERLYQVMADTLHKASTENFSYKPYVIVGYKDGEAVSMTTIIHKGEMAGIYNIGTKASNRHQGHAQETMTEAFRKAAALGVKILFLLTSSESELEETYRRMGFKPFTRHSMVKV